MLKLAIAATVAGMFSIAPAFADEMMKCDEANMMKMDKMVMETTDPAMNKQMEGVKEKISLIEKQGLEHRWLKH